MSIMKPGKKKESSENVKSILHGVQPQGKISHWKKLRLKRKLEKQKTLQSVLQVQGRNTPQAPVMKHKSHKSGKKAKKKMGPATVEESKNINFEKNSNAGNSEVKTSFRQTAKNGTVKHSSNKLRQQKQKRTKKVKGKHVSKEKKMEAVRRQDTSTESMKVTSENGSAKDPIPSNVLKLPVSTAEVSSNWKKLQSTLPRKRKRARSPPSKRGKLDTSATDGKEKKPEAAKDEIWFDDVDEILIEKRPQHKHSGKESQNSLVLPNATTDLTKALAMDCEMVGVGKGGEESVLARVSLVNQHGHCVYDKFVWPREKVTDFRTQFSGVRPVNLRSAEDFLVVQKEVADLLKGRLLVGHALHNDLKVLFLDHSRKLIRDTSLYKPFQQLMGTNRPSLKKLTAKVLGVAVQQGEHSSVQDAQAAMRLYTMHRKRWEQEVKNRRHKMPLS